MTVKILDGPVSEGYAQKRKCELEGAIKELVPLADRVVVSLIIHKDEDAVRAAHELREKLQVLNSQSKA